MFFEKKRGPLSVLPLLLVLFLCLYGTTLAEKQASPLLGEWAYAYEPDVSVLLVSADGTARFQDQAWRWEDTDGFLRLTSDEGTEMTLRYAITDKEICIYPRTAYRRGKEVEGQGGLIGIWEGIQGGSNFVFTPAGYFLEDSAFSGNYVSDPEKGQFLLHYGDAFADTLCYYTIEDDILTVEYPWPVVPLQP